MLELNLDHAATFVAYLNDRGSRFSQSYLKRPVLGFLVHSGNNRNDQCLPLYGVSKEISFGVPAFVISIMVWSTKSRPLSASLQAWNPTKP